MDETIKIIRVVLAGGESHAIRAAGWYTVFGKLTLYTIRGGRRRTVAEFASGFVVSVIETACEIGKAAE